MPAQIQVQNGITRTRSAGISPEELAFQEDTVKVTIALSKSSVDFFKREAEKHDTKYQQMIRRLLDAYTKAQGGHTTSHHRRTP